MKVFTKAERRSSRFQCRPGWQKRRVESVDVLSLPICTACSLDSHLSSSNALGSVLRMTWNDMKIRNLSEDTPFESGRDGLEDSKHCTHQFDLPAPSYCH